MIGVEPISAQAMTLIERSGGSAPEANAVAATSFADAISEAVANADARIAHANELARAFALDGAVPVHQVTIALEEARLAVDLAFQIRNRVIDGYRELMNMQL